MMNLNVKHLWLQALRSGRYYQSFGCLKDEDGYDALGVLCDIFGNIDNPWTEPSENFECRGKTSNTCRYCGRVNEEWENDEETGYVEPINSKDVGRIYGYDIDGDLYKYTLPEYIRNKADLNPNPIVNGIPLTNLNDIQRLNFDEIADLIEEYL